MRVLMTLVLAVGATQLGCAANSSVRANSGEKLAAENAALKDVDPVVLRAEDFAPATVELLGSGGNNAHRMGLLVAVVQRQLQRAANYFETGHENMAQSTLRTAFYLVRAGQMRDEMLTGQAATLAHAANVFARSGDEGQAEALYSLLVERLPASSQRNEAMDHLAALRRWQLDTRQVGSMQARAAVLRAAVHRSLLDPSLESQQRAREEGLTWVRQALTFGGEQRPPRSHFEQDETIAAFQAARTAALTFSALYLRQGDAGGAVEAVTEENVASLTSPALRNRLQAASESDPEAWLQLFQLFSAGQGKSYSGLSLDVDVANAAAWGAALELYRLPPHSLRTSVPLASLLLSQGMGEVVPVLLSPLLTHTEDPREVGWVLGVVLTAIQKFESLGDLPAARRTYHNSAAILQLAASPAFEGKLQPSPGRLHYQMGAQLAGAGALDEARTLLGKAIELEPGVPALRMVASIERQRGQLQSSLLSLNRILELPTNSKNAASRAETYRLRYEILREIGQTQEAGQSLGKALTLALQARDTASSRQHLAYAERLVGRVLEQFGQTEATHRAETRAFEASRNDLRQMTQSVLEASRRALTVGDLRAARQSVRKALSAELADEDTVYAALWLQLLEKRQGVHSDGTVEQAFASIETTTGWAASLTAWGRGKWTDQQLVARAENRTEKVEAMFYLAMSAPTSKDSLSQLRKVAASEAIQLVEVIIARDLLARQRHLPPPALPAGVKLP